MMQTSTSHTEHTELVSQQATQRALALLQDAQEQGALHAAERLDFGGVHINEVSSYRADHMPYGGVKASGMGREGPRYAIEEMSDTKIIIITT